MAVDVDKNRRYCRFIFFGFWCGHWRCGTLSYLCSSGLGIWWMTRPLRRRLFRIMVCISRVSFEQLSCKHAIPSLSLNRSSVFCEGWIAGYRVRLLSAQELMSVIRGSIVRKASTCSVIFDAFGLRCISYMCQPRVYIDFAYKFFKWILLHSSTVKSCHNAKHSWHLGGT